MDNVPFVSVVIPCRNEHGFIGACLDSVIANDYPKGRFEVLVVDGMSDDGTRRMVGQMMLRSPVRIELLDNPKRIVPTAMNIGIRRAHGDILVRIDAHGTYERDYIRQCVGLLQRADAWCVGGMQRPVGTNYVTRCIAFATSHPFGVGDASYRLRNSEAYVDTVYLGAWKKETLQAVGGFDETWVVNQDYELNYRLRQAGGGILLSPKIRSNYYVRGSLRALVKQYFRYGMWKVKTLVAHPSSLRWRQLAAPALVASLMLSLALLPLDWRVAALVPSLYVAVTLLISLGIAAKKGLIHFPLLPIVFFALHISWGIGFFRGIGCFGVPRIGPKTLLKALNGHESPLKGADTEMIDE